ncbi:VOC family protein [Pararhizobium sp.]|uniref:VOC family protein n=1 Tax=Pararhizobium sp. TaxID=1977563 RepID=UPI0027239245|nr:VOC family protein [Pararhizobium sp.]MDO9416516.1 VOC family protein [Pararhizobium sp.]
MAFTNVPPLQPHVCVKGGVEAIAFYQRAFGAENTFHQLADDGKRVMHTNLAIYGGEVMLHDELPEFGMPVSAPQTLGGSCVTININLPDPAAVDTAFAKAVDARALGTMPPSDVFWDARYARITDTFGHIWAFNAPLEQE